jgi:hypothetical protein
MAFTVFPVTPGFAAERYKFQGTRYKVQGCKGASYNVQGSTSDLQPASCISAPKTLNAERRT